MARRPRQAGFLLVSLSGMVVLLAVTAVAFMALARIGVQEAAASARRLGARLSAASGLEYAAARLAAEPLPARLPLLENRGDDWTCRVPSGPDFTALSPNPSYSHGEAWLDMGGGEEGAYDAGLDDLLSGWKDLDGDGRFSAWTARCRGGDAARFSLRVECQEAKLPVNAGYLDAGPDVTRDYDMVADHWDDDVHPYHKGLATVMDNLGVVLGVATRRKLGPSGYSTDPGDWIQPSWVGQDILRSRPLGGYRSLDEIDAVLAGYGYPADERQAILAHLDVGPYDPFGESARTTEIDPVNDFPPYVPLGFSVAPREVLAACWTCLAARADMASLSGETFNLVCPRTGTVLPQALKYFNPSNGQWIALLVFPDEALALADEAIDLRRSGPVSWHGLFQRFAEKASVLFARDHAALGGGLASRSWTQAKADLAFRAVCVDPYPWSLMTFYGAWAGWGVDRSPAPGVQQSHSVGFGAFARVAYPATPQSDWTYPLDPYLYADEYPSRLLHPQGLTLAPPGRFRVEASGRSGTGRSPAEFRCEGVLRLRELLEFTSQEDFENLTGGKAWASRGVKIPAEDRAGREARHDWREVDPPGYAYADGTPRVQPHVVTLPRWNWLSITTPQDALVSYPGFSRTYGGVALAGLESGLRGSQLYWPFKEDFDNVESVQDNGPYGDFVSERNGAFAYGPYVFPRQLFAGDADQQATPHQAIGTTDLLFQCPGVTGTTGDPIEAFSIESWMGPRSKIQVILGTNPTAKRLTIESVRSDGGNGVTETLFKLNGQYVTPAISRTWRIRDGSHPEGRTSYSYHVVLSVKKTGPATTDLSLFVNGRDMDDSGPPQTFIHNHAGTLLISADEKLSVTRCDGVRFYDWALQKVDAEERWKEGRFVQRGVYTSPLYVLDGIGRLDALQWTGVVPDGFPEGCLAAELLGYSDAQGTLEAWPPRPLPGNGAVHSLGDLAPVRSFRYRVAIDCRPGTIGAGKILDDTPVFESLWVTFRRPGRAPVWLGWRKP